MIYDPSLSITISISISILLLELTVQIQTRQSRESGTEFFLEVREGLLAFGELLPQKAVAKQWMRIEPLKNSFRFLKTGAKD